jgi:hypothetical protein
MSAGQGLAEVSHRFAAVLGSVLLGVLTGVLVLQLSLHYPISWPGSMIVIGGLIFGSIRRPRARVYFLTALALSTLGFLYGAALWLVLGGFG